MDVDRALSPEERTLFTPRDVHVGVLSNGSVSVSWRPPASDRPVALYRVWSDSVKVAEVPGTRTSQVIRLDGGRRHVVQVQAVDAEGNGSDRTEFFIVGLPCLATTDWASWARRGAVANWFGWFALLVGVVSLPFLGRLWSGPWQSSDLTVAGIGVALSMASGVIGLAEARSGWSKTASVLAVIIAFLGGAVIFLTLFLNEFFNELTSPG